MTKPLLGEKLAVLVANGFNEKDLIDMQRVAQELGADMRIISMDSGLVNSWNGDNWGLNFAADKALSAALAADYSMLVIPGGQRSIDKLKLTAHTRRFINGFIGADKPVVVLGEALELLEYAELLAGRTVGGAEEHKAYAEQQGAIWAEGGYHIEGCLMTGASLDQASEGFVSAVKEFLVADYTLDEAA